MKNTLRKISVVAFAILIGGCASKETRLGIGEFVSGSCTFATTGGKAPDWTCAPLEQFPKDYWYFVAVASNAQNDINLQRTIAMQEGRIALVRQARPDVEDMFKASRLSIAGTGETRTEITYKINSDVKSTLVLPPTFSVAEVYDEKGYLHVLMRASKDEMLQKINELEAKIEREEKRKRISEKATSQEAES
jgi:hypothetical protein